MKYSMAWENNEKKNEKKTGINVNEGTKADVFGWNDDFFDDI